MPLRKSKGPIRVEQVETIERRKPLWRIGGLTLPEIARTLFTGIVDNELLTRAAALSFYSMFALFPMLLSLLAAVGMFAEAADLHGDLGKRIGQLMPLSAFALVERTMREIALHSSPWKLVLGLLAALWSGAGGMSCIMASLDHSYRIRESRPFWKREIIAIGLTALVSALSFMSLVIVLAGGTLAEFAGEGTGLNGATIALWNVIQWPLALVFVLLSLALVYCFGPAVRQPWRWITPGSVLAVTVWVVASLLFRLYLRFFNTYGRSYGSLGAVMVLLLWLFITGFAILLGGELDAEIARAKPKADWPRTAR